MYETSLLKNGWIDLADFVVVVFVVVVFVIVKTRFVWKKIFGKSTEKVGHFVTCISTFFK